MKTIKTNKIITPEQFYPKDADNSTVIEKQVTAIMDEVYKNGNKALINFTEKFDQVKLTAKTMSVSTKEIAEAKKQVSAEYKKTAKHIKQNITNYYKEEKKHIKFKWSIKKKGKESGQRIIPLERAGLYIPNGTAPLVSTVFMTVIPAKVAGVKEIVAVTPPEKNGAVNPYILYTLDFLGVKKIFKAGGAHAIAALYNGTETIPKVDIIAGPGNVYVATAKKLLLGKVGIDMVAGPSEVLIVADSTANPKYVAMDMLSQAEHDPLSRSVLVTSSEKLATVVKKQIDILLKDMPRKEIIKKALKAYGSIIITKSLKQAIDISNSFAPEHLQLMVKDAKKYLKDITNAGTVFVGYYTPVSCGDFIAGPSHVLPTLSTARFSSYLSVDTFVKKTSYTYYSKDALAAEINHLGCIASLEGLKAHADSAKIRVEN